MIPRLLLSVLLVSSLSACGGGSGSSSDDPLLNPGGDSSGDSGQSDQQQEDQQQDEAGEQTGDSAAGGETPANCAASEFARSMLASINSYRAQARSCGDQQMPAVAALSWNCNLTESSRLHSLDMASNNFFSHTGSDGLSVGDRATSAGYIWRTVGENIAAGQTSLQQVMQGWINSPGHCVNIMRASFTEVGAALVVDDTSDYRRYWTQNFGAPR